MASGRWESMRVPRIVLLFCAAALAACNGGGGSEDAPPNTSPISAAGPDQVVDEQSLVTLDGSASSDPDGSIGSYAWSQLAGPPVVLGSAAAALTTFTAPALSAAETLTFELKVTDNRSAAATDVVSVTVNPIQGLNQAPRADAGPDRLARELGNVLLDGSASSDVDGSVVNYRWQQLSGPAVVIDDENAARTSFTAPAAPADLEFQLIVTDDEGAASAARLTITVVPETVLTLSGAVTFDLVPARVSFGRAYLDYGSTQAALARGVTVQLIDAIDRTTVLGSGRTAADGSYSVAVPNFAEGFVRVRAELVQSGAPGWNFRVVDNTNGDALYVVDGGDFNTGAADPTRDLHAASGWNGVSYAEPRAAAPFAILDLVYEATQLVLGADAATVFPALEIYWSENNRNVLGTDGQPDPATGELGTSFYRSGPGGGIFLLGTAGSDTEEYDRHVVAHEWGHYLEAQFSRSDSIGGPHTVGDQLDPRVAFGEGWGNAFSAMVTGDSVYKDTMGPQQAQGFEFDVESDSRTNAGWYNEFSNQEILYDVFDANADIYVTTSGTFQDNVDLGFGPIFDVLTGAQRTTVAVTSLFPFVSALKTQNLGAAAGIDDLLRVHDIEPVVIGDDYGSTEDNSGKPANADVLPIYAQLAVGGGAVEVCSTDDFSGAVTGSTNKLGSRRLLSFRTSVAGTHTFRATTTSAPAGTSTDPDMWLHRAGPLASSTGAPGGACTPDDLDQCIEVFSRSLEAGAEYVLEVYEWTNTNDSDDPDYPPIGRACFDVEVTQP